MENGTNGNNDKLVLEELHKNSRAAAEEIGKKLGLTRQTVGRIMKKLEDEKTIWGYSVVAAEQTNYYGNRQHFMALIKTENIEALMKSVHMMMFNKEERKKFLEKNHLSEIAFDFGAFYHGEYDMVMAFFADTLLEAKKLLSAMKTTEKYIIKIDILQPLLVIRRGGFVNPKLKEEFDNLL